ncbi:PHP domain-containing protein [Thermococcus sp.]
MKACFHIHTKYSFDSLMGPKKILKICKHLGADVVYITDHNTIKGSLEAKKYEKELGIEVILGTEIRTQYGDIIGVNITEEITTRDFGEVLDEIKLQGGISILPHPYRGHKRVEYLASKVDLIEVWNGHSTPEENQKALKLAQNLEKPPVVGSDAHIYSELRNAIMVYDSILDFEKTFYTSYPRVYQKELSSLIGHVRRGRIWNVPFVVFRMLGGLLRQ